MSWHFLQERGAACWDPRSSAGEPSALSNLLPFRAGFFYSVKLMDSSTSSPSGTTSRPSTPATGKDTSMSSRGASRVSPSAARVEVDELQKTCGPRCSESSDKCSRAGCSRRTCNRPPSSVPVPTFIDLGSTRATATSTRPAWVPRTDAADTGLLPTPTATANADCASMQKWPGFRRYKLWTGGRTTPAHWEFLMGWPIGWTDLLPLGMDKYRQWLLLHGEY